jgi:dihydroflavonol-4-reductase
MYLIELLLKRGHQVRGTLRRMDRAPSVRQALSQHAKVDGQLELVSADLNSDEGWHKAAAGVSGVFHVASPVPTKTPLRDACFVEPARRGTERVLDAALAAGAKRVVITSSVAAVTTGLPCRSTPFTEADWGNAEFAGPYEKSKIIAERAAWSWAEAHENAIEIATVNPSFVLGPAMWGEVSPSLDIVSLLISSKMPGVPNLNFGLVDVRDVAEAHYLAMTRREAAGHRFICNTALWSHQEIARAVHQHLAPRGVRVPTGLIPDWLVKCCGLFMPSLRFIAPRLGLRKDLDSTLLQSLLGWQPRSVEITLRETADSVLAMRQAIAN